MTEKKSKESKIQSNIPPAEMREEFGSEDIGSMPENPPTDTANTSVPAPTTAAAPVDNTKYPEPKRPAKRWSILILTQPSRAAYLARIKTILLPQLCEGVEMIISPFDSQHDLGTNRQNMIVAAEGEYVNFIDDDDIVPDDYVKKILPLLDGVDYVGYRVQMFMDGQKQKPTFHSLKYDKWSSDDNGWYRDLSHINPIKRELALKATMSGGTGEDARWADQLRALGIVKTEHFIDEPMYLYYFRSAKAEAARKVQVETHSEGPIVRKGCPKCGSTATGMAGGMRQCNMCQHRF